MNYIDNVNIKGQEYEIHDTDAREDITDLSSQLKNTKEFFGDMLLAEKTAGPKSIITIDDAAGFYAKDVVINIEPAQDKHGYDYPWPAGGGKNLLENGLTAVRSFDSSNNDNVSYTVTPNKDGTFYIVGSGTTTQPRMCVYNFVSDSANGPYNQNQLRKTLPNGNYKFVFADESNSKFKLQILGANTSGTSVTPVIASGSSGDFVIDDTYAYNWIQLLVLEECDLSVGYTVRPMILRQSETDLTWAPYSNICSITGWDEATVKNVGVNMFSGFNLGWSYDNTTGEKSTDKSNAYCSTDYIRIGNTLHLKNFSDTLSNGSVSVLFYDDSKNYIAGSKYAIVGGSDQPTDFIKEQDYPISIPQDAVYATFKVYRHSDFGSADAYTEASIMLSTDVTTVYEPCKSRTASVDFPSTVYGGTVDLTTGECVVDTIGMTLNGTESWAIPMNSDDVYRLTFTDIDTPPHNDVGAVRSCSHFKNNVITTQNTNIGFYVYKLASSGNTVAQIRPGIDSITDKTSWKSWLAAQYQAGTPVTWWFKCLEPVDTFTLTPAQLELFKGVNNISVDAGKITVKYWEQKDLQSIIKETFQVTGEKLII